MVPARRRFVYHDAGLGLFGVAQTPGLVHLLTSEAEVRDRRLGVPFKNASAGPIATR